MKLDLTKEDAQRLGQLLRDYLPDLQREMARTDERSLRHELVLRVELCEGLVARLGAADGEPAR